MPRGIYERTPDICKALSDARKKDWRDRTVRQKFLAAMKNPETKKKKVIGIKKAWRNPSVRGAWLKGLRSIEARKAWSDSMKKHMARHGVNFKGGNGRRPVPFVISLGKMLKPLGYIREYAIGGLGRTGNYKVDFALVQNKIAIECDGRSHRTVARKLLDKKKDIALRAIGWKVIRVPHD